MGEVKESETPEEKQPKTESEDGEGQPCPNCGTMNLCTRSSCSHCGESLGSC